MSKEISEVDDKTARRNAVNFLNAVISEKKPGYELVKLQIEAAKLIISATEYLSIAHYEMAAKRAAMADQDSQEAASA